MKQETKERLIKDTEEKIKKLLDEGIQSNNLMLLGELVDIQKDLKEIGGDNMRYEEYGRYSAYNNYGDNYGRRGRDRRYRGDEYLERMSGEYGRYQDSRERYGASQETDKSFHYMVKALEDFIKVLEEEAENQEQKMQLRQALQNAMM